MMEWLRIDTTSGFVAAIFVWEQKQILCRKLHLDIVFEKISFSFLIRVILKALVPLLRTTWHYKHLSWDHVKRRAHLAVKVLVKELAWHYERVRCRLWGYRFHIAYVTLFEFGNVTYSERIQDRAWRRLWRQNNFS